MAGGWVRNGRALKGPRKSNRNGWPPPPPSCAGAELASPKTTVCPGVFPSPHSMLTSINPLPWQVLCCICPIAPPETSSMSYRERIKTPDRDCERRPRGAPRSAMWTLPLGPQTVPRNGAFITILLKGKPKVREKDMPVA